MPIHTLEMISDYDLLRKKELPDQQQKKLFHLFIYLFIL